MIARASFQPCEQSDQQKQEGGMSYRCTYFTISYEILRVVGISLPEKEHGTEDWNQV